MTAVSTTTSGLDDLRERIAALKVRFTEIGGRAARAAAAVTEGGAPPSEQLLTELTAAAQDFHALREDVLESAAGLEVGLPKPADTVVSLRDLVPVVDAVASALVNAERRRRHEAARAAALHVIDRVQAIAHRDDPAFAPLAECQAKARARHDEIAASGGDEADIAAWAEQLSPFANLLEMLEGGVDDARFTELADGVAAAFGRSLATAATRGRLRLR
jgi:hypothetical protein